MFGYAVFYFIVSILWIFVFLALSGKNKMKPLTIFLVFMAGLLSGPLAGGVSILLEKILISKGVAGADHLKNFIVYFIIVGPVEEGAKFLAVLVVVIRRTDMKTSTHGILLAITAGLGFAAGENVLYMLSYGVGPTLPRLFLGNLGHAAFAVYWGYGLGVVFNERASQTLLITGLTMAALFHGAYNFLLTLNYGGAFLAFLLSGILWYMMLKILGIERDRNK